MQSICHAAVSCRDNRRAAAQVYRGVASASARRLLPRTNGGIPFNCKQLIPISFTQMNGNSRDILRLWLWQLLRTAFGGGTLSTVEPFHFGGCDHATDQASFD